MIKNWIHSQEIRRWQRDNNRTVLPFEWGLDCLGISENGLSPRQHMHKYAASAIGDSKRFFTAPPTSEYALKGEWLSFPSAIATPTIENNTCYGRLLQVASKGRAVIVLPQWNADPDGHLALCRFLNRFGLTTLRLSMPYHDRRKPPTMERAEYMVSANVGRTIQSSRQAILDVRRSADWLIKQGYDKLAILGTSIGSSVGFIAFAHDERFRTGVFNHVSSYFADVVWTGLTTQHVRKGLERAIDLDELRKFWSIISPYPFVERVAGDRQVLMISGKYDLSFLPHLSQELFAECRRLSLSNFKVALLPCGHYTLGNFPFNYIAALRMVRHLLKNLA
ncbi:MAG: abhydrolase domain-containing 18 [Acidobacteria bacterium]|nr:abhydrolase domain-containing 18 [Acidobacteriota bacterium]MBI3656739.1 abhydrolase domain-containing 18 [Acidobacteriota bacterium]